MYVKERKAIRFAIVIAAFLTVAAALPVTASVSEGLAGKLGTGLQPNGASMCQPDFQWYEFYGLQPLSPTDMLTLEMALIPFDSGATYVGVDGDQGTTFFGVTFEGGTVDGLAYDPAGWNEVRIDIRPGSQDYLITVNGNQAGPFSLAGFCAGQGGCYSAQSLRVHSLEASAEAHAWMDSLSVTITPDGGSPLTHFDATFDDGATYTGYPGTIVASEPPAGSGGGPAGAGAPPKDLMKEVGEALSSPGMRGAVRSSVLEKLRGAIKTMHNADLKAVRVLDQLIPILEAERGHSIPVTEADELLAMARDARDALTAP